ncbi:MAG: TetR/AcrR family transcriptional regulator [Pseudomonadota bacterium]
MLKPPIISSAKPLKRPLQARAKFTVQAIFDAFVRIWRRDGWERLTTRAVALETGIAVGTLYDYFPNKSALLSGYVRHCIEQLLREIAAQAVAPPGLEWRVRIAVLTRLVCGVDAPELPWFDAQMLALEAQIAEPKHHRRVHEELTQAWHCVFAACTDLAAPPPAALAEALHLSVWGARRYGLLIALDAEQMRQWAGQAERICIAAIAASQPAPAA